MRSKLILPLVLVFLLLLPAVSAVWYLDAESITVDMNIRSGLKIERTGPDYALEYVTANISFIPLNLPEQEVLRLVLEPQPKVSDDNYVFRWDDPVPANPGFSVDAKIKTRQIYPAIGRSTFPYHDYPSTVLHYTEPGTTIDSDNYKIITKASELAAGEDDYFKVVFKMADWTKNYVHYDLSTVTQKASQKASWVMENEEGVCDEITTLFIALLRAVGIPARFVAGIAYTESPQFPERWGPHGWAEVYFPDAGWVPFDVTYGEFGFVDPTHIILKRSFDAGESDTKYTWLGRDVNIITLPISVTADLEHTMGMMSDKIGVSVRAEQDFMGIGSYNLVVAELTNPTSSYVATQVFLASIAEMEMLSSKAQSVMIPPFGTSHVYWLVKVIDSLDPHYTYTFPLTVATLKNTTANSAFSIIPGSTKFSKEEMSRIMEAGKKESEAKLSGTIKVSCKKDQELYYTYDGPHLNCTVKNTGNVPFKGVDFCFENSCTQADLLIAQDKTFEHTITNPEAGISKLMFSVEGPDISKSFFFDLEILEEPVLYISKLEYPSEIEFGNKFNVEFMLSKNSSAYPENVTVNFAGIGKKKSFEENVIEGDKKYIIELNSEDLSLDPNEFVISAQYYDKNGKLSTLEGSIEINLVNVTFGQKLVIWLKDADRWIRGLFS